MSVVTMMAAAKRGDVAVLRKLMDPVRSGLPGDLAEEVFGARV